MEPSDHDVILLYKILHRRYGITGSLIFWFQEFPGLLTSFVVLICE
jgi:hypothetical protein